MGPGGMSPRAAFLATRERVPIAAAEGRIAAECLAAYPPGIPNVIPGERLTGAEPRQPAAHARERRHRARRRRPDAADLLVVAEPAALAMSASGAAQLDGAAA